MVVAEENKLVVVNEGTDEKRDFKIPVLDIKNMYQIHLVFIELL